MKREELINQAAEQFADREHGAMRNVSVFNLLQYAFKCGAEWAYCGHKIVWHPASEQPLPNKDIIVAAYNDEHNRRDIWYISLTPDIIADFSRERNLLWAYITDLLPSAKCSRPSGGSKGNLNT